MEADGKTLPVLLGEAVYEVQLLHARAVGLAVHVPHSGYGFLGVVPICAIFSALHRSSNGNLLTVLTWIVLPVSSRRKCSFVLRATPADMCVLTV